MSIPDVAHAQFLEQEILTARYTGTGTIQKGTALCFDSDRGTAGDFDGRRLRHVELPSVTNNKRFAGVAAQTYSGRSNGRKIDIVRPGSPAELSLSSDTVVDTTILGFTVGGSDAGRWSAVVPAFPGAGRALALQTVTAQLAGQMTGAGVLDSTGLILTGTGFTVAPAVAAGDKVVILSGEQDASNAATAAEYTVSSVTNNTTLVLTSVASDGGTMQVSYYVRRANPLALCLMENGPQSGGIHFVASSGGGAKTVPNTGMKVIMGAITPAADLTEALADGEAMGDKSGWYLDGTITTHDYLITPATLGFAPDGTTLVTAELDADTDFAIMTWNGYAWDAKFDYVGTAWA